MMIDRLWRWLRQQSHAQRRRRDTKVLWPQLLQTYGDQDAARNAFRLHISLDPAWRDLEEDERHRIPLRVSNSREAAGRMCRWYQEPGACHPTGLYP